MYKYKSYGYKSHLTVKFLKAISPMGVIIFSVGHVSENYITVNKVFIKKLIHGELVLDDQGFDIAEALAAVVPP